MVETMGARGEVGMSEFEMRQQATGPSADERFRRLWATSAAGLMAIVLLPIVSNRTVAEVREG